MQKIFWGVPSSVDWLDINVRVGRTAQLIILLTIEMHKLYRFELHEIQLALIWQRISSHERDTQQRKHH